MSSELIGVLATVAVALVTAAGAGLWKIITLILKTYKDQADATVDAKDAEVGTLRADNDRLTAQVISELSALREQHAKTQEDISELRQDVLTLWRRGEPR